MRYDLPTHHLRLDGDDVVESVSDGFNGFVGQHWLGGLEPLRPGSSFWDFVEGGQAVSLYEVMLERARGRHAVTVDMRAATASRIVGVELGLTPHGFDDEVDVALRVLYERSCPPLPLFDRDAVRDDSEVRVCAFCQRLFAFDWVEPELGVEQLRITGERPQPRVGRAVCTDCETTIYAHCGTARLRL